MYEQPHAARLLVWFAGFMIGLGRQQTQLMAEQQAIGQGMLCCLHHTWPQHPVTSMVSVLTWFAGVVQHAAAVAVDPRPTSLPQQPSSVGGSWRVLVWQAIGVFHLDYGPNRLPGWCTVGGCIYSQGRGLQKAVQGGAGAGFWSKRVRHGGASGLAGWLAGWPALAVDKQGPGHLYGLDLTVLCGVATVCACPCEGT
jgi:hypothetical protein